MERSRRAAETADLVIAVADGSRTPPAVDPDILALAAKAPHWVFAVSKSDLNPAVKTAVWQLPKGLREPDGPCQLQFRDPRRPGYAGGRHSGLLPRRRPRRGRFPADQRPAGVRCPPEPGGRPAGIAALNGGLTPDAVLTDAEEALEAVGELTGRTAKEEIVGAVFSRFCVGK